MTDPIVQAVLVYGAGGHAREVAWLLEERHRAGDPRRPAGFIDDAWSAPRMLNDLPVFSPREAAARFPSGLVLIGIGHPRTRERVAGQAVALGFRIDTAICPTVARSERVTVDEGCVICAGAVLTTNVRVGRHVHVNVGCTVSHDVVLDDYVTLSPGVHICGAVHLGRRAFVGAGAVVVNGAAAAPLMIGEDAVIGAGACVTASIPAGTTVVGVPARPVAASPEPARQ